MPPSQVCSADEGCGEIEQGCFPPSDDACENWNAYRRTRSCTKLSNDSRASYTYESAVTVRFLPQQLVMISPLMPSFGR